jgi:hypothetical protein
VNGVGWQRILAQNLQQPSIDVPIAIGVALTHHGPELWWLAAVSAVVGILRRSRVSILMLGWYPAVAAIALIPPIIGDLVPPSMVLLMAFLPTSILIGAAAQWAYARLKSPHRVVRATAWAAALISVSLIGARDMVSVVNPATVLFTRADANAMQWINANVPSHSTFLVNSFNWTGNMFLPSDAGGWIPYFTDNAVEYPETSVLKSDSESKLLAWIGSHKINYLYFGRRAGILQSADFLDNPERFSAVYNREGVKIFQIR